MRIVHPLADEWTEQYAVFVAAHDSVLLTDPLDAFLQWSLSEGLRPVLVTGRAARLSPLVSLAMHRSGGCWAVRDEGRVYDGLTGFRVGSFPELWADQAPGRERLDTFDRLDHGTSAVLGYNMFGHQRAAAETRVGGLAETVHESLGGRGLDVWGLTEPLLEPFSVDVVTETARRTMPNSPPLHAKAADGSYCAIQVGRTRRGILEHVVGGVPFGPYPNELAPAVERATRTLTAVESNHQPTIGFVSLVDAAPDLRQTAAIRRPEVPLAVLLGPRAVHDLGARVDGLRDRHDVLQLGRRRLPSLLVRFSRPDVGSWAQLMAFAHDLGVDRVQAAAAVEGM